MQKRTLVFGDIHGGLRALQQLFERAEITTNDTLIFLGDYVDGWSESAAVIQFLIETAEKQDCIFIRGNHDVWCENYLKTNRISDEWLFNGGQSTWESYKNREQDFLNHINFFERMKDYHVDAQNRLFIHAGFSSMHGPSREVYSSNYSWDRSLWETAIALDDRIEKDSVFYPRRLKLFAEIYIGHTPTINYGIPIPMHKANVWNVDTGAAFMGKISCLDIETKEFWQSDVVQNLYPNERGRNNYNVKLKE
ncbi:serine/threonine protein phosphatase [Flavobacterium sp. TP390]|uniref:Serine/threonine protein phosphatase n=1 Tax=Flavobacterium profundi TaxID=1774945 RepID=A0A6I4IJ15_9FLAO|nr:metallophosphoesterase family protein [Flavobacterium profundi]MVO09695.1 serine/threonine protein phosphatase [Flavobacterium profundi]